ncbi:cob(I)yrinic acid a,c-diamide adenosyltransferase [Candidatus Collierbacteria bacterium]|nr:cob(I)yrinic acid a,c-diamide adenosyltransferase [Candidatus Collierbacteria bacterium]
MKDNAIGLVYIFTGNGKGKTSAALGVAMRAVGQGKRVAMIQWYKEKRWRIGEHNLPEMLASTKKHKKAQKSTRREIGSFEIYPMGLGFYKLPTDHASANEHRKAAGEALELTRELLSGKMIKMATRATKSFNHLSHPNHLFLLILDEAINAVNDKLIDLIDLIDLISKRGQTHIILTGRNAPKQLIDLAELVTEMKNIKHPFDSGRKAVMGLDY